MSGSTRFAPDRVERFVFAGWELDRRAARLALNYRLDPGPEFTETIVFPEAGRAPPEPELRGRIILLHLLAGVSYYKAACPPVLDVAYPVPPALLGFVRTLYFHGLGEFAFRNGLALGDRLNFRAPGGELEPAPAVGPEAGVVVPLGGGKDSLVTVDLLERAGRAFSTIAVAPAPLIRRVARRVGRPHIAIERRLSPRLGELNARGALNGHVPISAILAGVMACAAPWYGYGTVVMSNERSAEAGNVRAPDGTEVNHQYSKTLAFERALQALLDELAPGLRYFSLLRPFSELAIARHFARLTRYHDVFSSCNANFRLGGPAARRWCCECPKCRFAFLVLAPFLDRPALLDVFGANLLDDETQLPGFEALLGLHGHKPFECVGEIEESRAALAALGARPEWRDDAVPRRLAPRLPAVPLDPWLEPAAEHAIPAAYLEVVDALGRA